MKDSKKRHFIFIWTILATVFVYPLIMIKLPVYKNFYCDKDKDRCEYVESNIYHHTIKNFDFKIYFSSDEMPVLTIHESLSHGLKGNAQKRYQLLLNYHGKEYKIFSCHNNKNYIYGIKNSIIQQLNNKEHRYCQIAEGDAYANFWSYFIVLLLSETVFYYFSLFFINKKSHKICFFLV